MAIDEHAGRGCPMSRRRFLQAAAGAGAAASTLGLAPGSLASALAAEAEAPAAATRFGRMFPGLAPFATPGDALTEALLDIARPGGMMDADDDLAAGPVQLIVDPALSANNPNNPTHTAGATFVGQFIDHDLTFDRTSTLNVPTEPGAVVNARTPRLDLDSVYGAGPTGSPQLYDPADPAKLAIGHGGLFEDLPRDEAGNAVIVEPRNDENLVIAGLHSALICFHNKVVDALRSGGRRRSRADWTEARNLTVWHYQWIVLNEILPMYVGPAMVAEVRASRRYFRPSRQQVMPVEFQGAAYRFGHSMVRPSYRANLAGDGGQPFFGFIFDADAPPSADPDDLVGGHRAPRRFIGWQTFFDFGDGEARPNKRIDTKLSSPLFNLPLSAIASGDLPVVLAQRTLLRHVTWSMPSGQAVARRMGLEPLGPADLDELSSYGLGLEASTPLFYYVLKEAELLSDGLYLGPVGGRIVAEVLLDVVERDPRSYLNQRPAWAPTLPDRQGNVTGDFRMVDLLAFAGVDPASRGQ